MVSIGLMAVATIVIPMLEDGNGHMQTVHAVIDSSCYAWYNPTCANSWADPSLQTP
jgi:hypothetical protein